VLCSKRCVHGTRTSPAGSRTGGSAAALGSFHTWSSSLPVSPLRINKSRRRCQETQLSWSWRRLVSGSAQARPVATTRRGAFENGATAGRAAPPLSSLISSPFLYAGRLPVHEPSPFFIPCAPNFLFLFISVPAWILQCQIDTNRNKKKRDADRCMICSPITEKGPAKEWLAAQMIWLKADAWCRSHSRRFSYRKKRGYRFEIRTEGTAGRGNPREVRTLHSSLNRSLSLSIFDPTKPTDQTIRRYAKVNQS
jgi:hypothetical protein